MSAKSRVAVKLSAHQCVAALRERYPARSHALLEQVANGTGWAAKRWADVVTLGLWPSRGLTLSGFEIKISRSDWKRELDDPAKADEIQGFCSEWWVVAPMGLLTSHEMPPTWGLLEVTEKLKCRVTKPAPALEPKPITLSFVAAVLRRASESADDLARREREVGRREGAENGAGGIAARLKGAELQVQELVERLTEFERLSGVSIAREWQLGNVAKAVWILVRGEQHMGIQNMRAAAKHYAEIAKRVAKDADELERLLAATEATRHAG